MPQQVLLEVDVDEVRRQRANRLHARILGPSEPRPIEIRRKDAEVGDADDRAARADVEERLGEGGNERDHPPRRGGEGERAAERVDQRSVRKSARRSSANAAALSKSRSLNSAGMTPPQMSGSRSRSIVGACSHQFSRTLPALTAATRIGRSASFMASEE